MRRFVLEHVAPLGLRNSHMASHLTLVMSGAVIAALRDDFVLVIRTSDNPSEKQGGRLRL